MALNVKRAIEDENYSLAFSVLKNRRMEINKIDNTQVVSNLITDLDNELSKIINQQKLPDVTDVKKPNVYMDIKDVYDRCDEQGQKPKFRVGRVGKKWNNKTQVLIVNEVFWVVNINWHFYKQMLMIKGLGHLIKKYNIEKVLSDFKLVKQLSTFMLVNGPKVPGFNYLVGIEHVFGFNVQVAGTSSLKEVKEWVNSNFKPQINNDTAGYLVKFREKVKIVLRNNRKTKTLHTDVTAEQYCNNIVLTGTSGSAFDPGGEIPDFTVHGVDVKYKKNKFSKSVALGLENKIKRLFSKKAIYHKVNDKIEVYPKRRIIVSSDYNSTLKMRFVDSWLGDWLRGNNYSSLWRNKKQSKQLWLDFMNKVNTKEWNIPVDQSAFDHHVSKDMVIIVLEEIKTLILESMTTTTPATKQEYIDVMDTIVFGLQNGKVVYTLKKDDEGYIQGKETNIEMEYNSGVLSGWQWTSKINTISNVAEGLIALELCKPLTIEPTQFDATGDDQNTTWSYLSDGMLYWLSLTSSGFEIHPSKNFFSQQHNEYLRLYSDFKGINGYPARNINRILWQYPGDIEDKTFSGRLNGTFDKWEKFRTRLGIEWKDMSEYLIDDLKGQKLPNNLIQTFLYGNILNNNKQISNDRIIDGMINYIPGTWLYHVEIHGEGYESFKAFFGYGQESDLDEWILEACNVNNETREGKKIKSDQEVVIVEGNSELYSVKQSNFTPREEKNKIRRPQLQDGWVVGDIFTMKEEVINKAFVGADKDAKAQHLPKSWYYDYITGRTSLKYPVAKNCSQAGSKLLSYKVENSAYNAMLFKKTKDNKWLSIVKKYFYSISTYIDNVLLEKIFNI